MDEFDQAEQEEEAERARQNAEEKTHVDNLLASPSGKWFLGIIVHDWMVSDARDTKGNSWDMYNAGRHSVLQEQKDLIVRHAGYKILDILKG